MSNGSERGIIINKNNSFNPEILNNVFLNKLLICDNQANYYENTITLYDDYKISLPINEKEILILKSMTDIYKNNFEQDDKIKCSIYDEIFKMAKPMEVIYI